MYKLLPSAEWPSQEQAPEAVDATLLQLVREVRSLNNTIDPKNPESTLHMLEELMAQVRLLLGTQLLKPIFDLYAEHDQSLASGKIIASLANEITTQLGLAFNGAAEFNDEPIPAKLRCVDAGKGTPLYRLVKTTNGRIAAVCSSKKFGPFQLVEGPKNARRLERKE